VAARPGIKSDRNGRRPPRQPLLPGKLSCAGDRLELADCRRYLTILEWRLFFSGLRNRPRVWSKENGTPSASQSPLMQINADAVCLVRTQFTHIREVAVLPNLALQLRLVHVMQPVAACA
jgi:hypothetical protein